MTTVSICVSIRQHALRGAVTVTFTTFRASLDSAQVISVVCRGLAAYAGVPVIRFSSIDVAFQTDLLGQLDQTLLRHRLRKQVTLVIVGMHLLKAQTLGCTPLLQS